MWNKGDVTRLACVASRFLSKLSELGKRGNSDNKPQSRFTSAQKNSVTRHATQAITRPEQSMAITARVTWLCACARFLPWVGVRVCHLLLLLFKWFGVYWGQMMQNFNSLFKIIGPIKIGSESAVNENPFAIFEIVHPIPSGWIPVPVH